MTAETVAALIAPASAASATTGEATYEDSQPNSQTAKVEPVPAQAAATTPAAEDEPGEMESAPPQPEAVFAESAAPAEPEPENEREQTAQDEEYSPEPKVLVRPETRARFQQGARVAASTALRLIGAVRAQTQSFKNWISQAFPRLLPVDPQEQRPALFSQAWPIFFAIAIPVVLVVAAGMVYYQTGYTAQYQIYYTRADKAAQQALKGEDTTNERVQWQATLDWLDKADQFQTKPTSESLQLRQIAQDALDKLDYIVRVNFQPAFDTSLGKNLQVTRMSASDTDIYLLDATNGSVKRGTYNNNAKKYSLDAEFTCGPGLYDGIQVGNLIDIIALPRSNPIEATLLGIDNSGNLLYCIPGKLPVGSYLQMPVSSWKSITAIAYDANNLYVLDAPARAVWVYFGDSEIKFPDKPYFFFESQVPVALQQAIDMAVNGDDLYLLNDDGHMTTCTLSRISVSPTRCNDPALYIDPRPGYAGGLHLSDGIFSQIAFPSVPDRSVALLEPYTQSVFRFKLDLSLRDQVHAGAGKENTLPKGAPVTAMAFSPNKVLFLFLDNQVFFATNVP
jgi:hypothetical protein